MNKPLTCGLAALCIGTLPLLSACLNDSGSVAVWTGPPFSAELVDLEQPTKPASRIYLSDGKLRLESEDTSSVGALVLDPARNSTLLVNDRDKAYLDAGMFTSLVTVTFAPMIRFFRPAGSGDPCTQWNTMTMPFRAFAHDKSEQMPHFTCRGMGTDRVDGRPAHKWEWTNDAPDGGTGTVWIDDRLQVVSRSSDKDGGMELRHVKEGPVPASLFTPPASYRKISVASMLGGVLHGSGNGQSDTSGAAGLLRKLQGAGAHH